MERTKDRITTTKIPMIKEVKKSEAMPFLQQRISKIISNFHCNIFDLLITYHNVLHFFLSFHFSPFWIFCVRDLLNAVGVRRIRSGRIPPCWLFITIRCPRDSRKVIAIKRFSGSNCRIPGLVVSRRRHSLKNESEYNRGYSYANKWAGYSAI